MKTNGTRHEPGEQFVKLPRDLVRSDAWRSASINARRLLDFLMNEEMNSWTMGEDGKLHTGNGRLKAPHRQLVESGISAGLVESTITEAQDLGLINAHRPGNRYVSTFALTWLATHDGKAPSNAWKEYRCPKKPDGEPVLTPLPERKQKSASGSGGSAASRSGGRLRNLPSEVEADSPQNTPKSASTSGGAS